MTDTSTDTIAAISSGMSAGGIGIVRVSGKDALKIAGRVCVNARGENDLALREPNTIRYGYLIDGDSVRLDEILISVFRAPHSYTGEDLVELNVHGGLLLLQKALSLLLDAGARAAEPGEFTKRAFLNGRIDLTGAEAVMDVISAENEFALRNASMQLRGGLREKIDGLRQEILHETAFIEAALDDPEHFSLDGYGEILQGHLDRWSEALLSLKTSFYEGKRRKEGIPAAVIGSPNAGKSSFFNRLYGEMRAIVTAKAGTTRDTIEEVVQLKDITLRLTDTAGLRETSDEVEAIGTARAIEAAKDAELIFLMLDESKPLLPDEDWAALLSGKTVFVLENKSDLEKRDEEGLSKIYKDLPGDIGVFRISVTEGSGLDELTEAVRERFFKGAFSPSSSLILTNARHADAVSDAVASLDAVSRAIADGMPEDLFTVDLTDAYSSLSGIIGEAVGEDLIDEIFSSFCMGK